MGKGSVGTDYAFAAIVAGAGRRGFRRHGSRACFRLRTQRFGNTGFMALGTERNHPGQLLHLLPAFCQGTLQLVALAETRLYFGKGDRR